MRRVWKIEPTLLWKMEGKHLPWKVMNVNQNYAQQIIRFEIKEIRYFCDTFTFPLKYPAWYELITVKQDSRTIVTGIACNANNPYLFYWIYIKFECKSLSLIFVFGKGVAFAWNSNPPVTPLFLQGFICGFGWSFFWNSRSRKRKQICQC